MDNYDYRRPTRFRPGRFDVTIYEDERGMKHWSDDKLENVGKGPRGYVRSDERIREEVCERLTFSHRVDASKFEIFVSEGIVTLEGVVNNRRQRRLSEQLIEDLPGVKNVHNHLTILKHVDGWVPHKTGKEERWHGIH